jgi:N-sulfoglucosamine sulfohydrolase
MKKILIVPLLFLASLAFADQAEGRPNILFCISDDQSFPHASAYGTTWVKTPAFDRVAREGVLFTRAYTPNAKCAPSRSIIITGRNSWQLEAAANHVPNFPDKFKSFVEALGEQGYTTGMTGKGWAPGNANGRLLTGKQYAKQKARPPAKGMSNNDYAANFKDFMDAASADAPWCFWYGATEPHRGYEFKSGENYAGKKPSDIDAVPAFWPDNETVRHDMLDYAFEIEHFDAHLGRIIQLLEERGQLENTLIMVTADNGMPFPRVKGQTYELSHHLPLAIMWKKGIASPGRVVEDYVSFVDFAPTIIQAAGLDWAGVGMSPTPGKSLFDIFTSTQAGQVNPARDHVLIGKERHDLGRPHDGGYPVRGMVKNGMLYILNYEIDRWPAGNPETGYMNTDGSPTKTHILDHRTDPAEAKYWQWNFGKKVAEELYDLQKDSACINNLALNPEKAPIRKAMQEQVLAELKAEGDPRALGNGAIFDAYPYAQDSRGYYERFKAGGKVRAGWINPSDIAPAPLD